MKGITKGHAVGVYIQEVTKIIKDTKYLSYQEKIH